MVRRLWFICYGSYVIVRRLWFICYGSYVMVRMLCFMGYGSYVMVHKLWLGLMGLRVRRINYLSLDATPATRRASTLEHGFKYQNGRRGHNRYERGPFRGSPSDHALYYAYENLPQVALRKPSRWILHSRIIVAFMIECAPSLVQMIASLIQLQWRAVFVLLVALVAKGWRFDQPPVLIHKRRVFFWPSSGNESDAYHFYISATKFT